MIKYEIEKLKKLQSYAELLEKYVPVNVSFKCLPEYNYTHIPVNSKQGDYNNIDMSKAKNGYMHRDIIDALNNLKNIINGDNNKQKLYDYIKDKIKIYTYAYRKENNKPTIYIDDEKEIKIFNKNVDDSNMEHCGGIVIGDSDYTSYYDEENLQPYMVLCPAPMYKQYKNLKWYEDRYGSDYEIYYPLGYNKENIQEYLDKHNLGKA